MIWTYVCLHLCKHYLLVSQGLVLQLGKNTVFFLNSISRNKCFSSLMLPNFYDPKIWQLHQNVGNIPINYQNFFCPILKIFPSEILIIIKKKNILQEKHGIFQNVWKIKSPSFLFGTEITKKNPHVPQTDFSDIFLTDNLLNSTY